MNTGGLTETRNAASKHVFGLDAMRAAAILMVLAAHTWPFTAGYGLSFLLGAFGVEMFFVLSGFLIGGILLRLVYEDRFQTWPDLAKFWRRRWYRTLPAYYLFLLMRMAWADWAQGDEHAVWFHDQYFLFLQNLTGLPPNFFPETWSLSIEEWFYLLFPFLLWMLVRFMKNKERACGIAILTFLVVPFLYRFIRAGHANLVGHAQWDTALRKAVVMRLDVLMYGVAAAFISLRRPGLWNRLIRFWLLGPVLVAVAASSLAFNWPLDAGRVWEGLLLWPCIATGFTLILVRASVALEPKRYIARPVAFVAAVSYTLYLCHGLAMLMISQYFSVNSLLYLPERSWSWTLPVWALAFLMASAVFYLFEKPIRDLRDR